MKYGTIKSVGDIRPKTIGSENINTVLLLPFDGADASVYTRDMSFSNKAVTFVGTAQLDTAQYKFGVSSLVLDGNSDYVSLVDSDDWTPGTGAFTIRIWVRFDDLTTFNDDYYFCGQYADASNYWRFEKKDNVTGGNKLNFRWRVGGTDIIEVTQTAAWTVSVNTWYYIELNRSGSSGYFFIDGTNQAFTVNTGSWGDFTNIAAPLVIGARGDGGAYFLKGWVDDFQIVKGQALHTSDFNPNFSDTTSPIRTVLKLPFDGTDAAVTTVDYAMGRPVTFYGTAQIDTAQYKFGGSSLLLDGNSDYVSLPESDDWYFSIGNFTISCWVRFNAFANSQDIAGQFGSVGNYGWLLTYRNIDTTLRFTYSTNGTLVYNVNQTWAPVVNTWYHTAIVRNGTAIKTFVDGIQLGSDYDIAGNTIFDSTDLLKIGGPAYLDGWIDDLQIVKGRALYTADFAVDTINQSQLLYVAGDSLPLLGGVGTGVNFQKLGQSFEVTAGGINCARVDLDLCKFGTPTDNVTLRIETDSAGAPSGTLVGANATATMAVAGFPTYSTFAWQTFSFAGIVTLAPSTTYWLVLIRSGAYDASNYVVWGNQATDVYADGNAAAVMSSNAWAQYATQDLTFKIYDAVLGAMPPSTVQIASHASGNTLYVGPNCTYTTIQSALNAASAGDTILVAPGTYTEAITFGDDNVTVKALGYYLDTTITQTAATVVNFSTMSGCVLEGFTVALTAADGTTDYSITSANDDASVYNYLIDCKVTWASSVTLATHVLLYITDGNFEIRNCDLSLNSTYTGTTAQVGWVIWSHNATNTLDIYNSKLTGNWDETSTTGDHFGVDLDDGVLANIWNSEVNLTSDVQTTGIVHGLEISGATGGTMNIYNTKVVVNATSTGRARAIDSAASGRIINSYNNIASASTGDADGVTLYTVSGSVINSYGDVLLGSDGRVDATGTLNRYGTPKAGDAGYKAVSTKSTGGSGSAGAGKQYVEIKIAGTIYKSLYET